MARRVKAGDIIEFKTPTGIAYALYTHTHSMFGDLLHVYSRVYEGPLPNLATAISNSPTFSTFFPLQAGMHDPQTEKVSAWWLWDGTNEWEIGALVPEQRSLPIREVINDTLLVERITSGWTAESEDG